MPGIFGQIANDALQHMAAKHHKSRTTLTNEVDSICMSVWQYYCLCRGEKGRQNILEKVAKF